MLRINDIRASYGNIQALHGIDLHVKPGQIVTLLGPNGAGKTTTLRVIAGLMRQRHGSVVYQGESIDGRAPHERVALGISLVPEHRAIFNDMSVEDNLELGAYTRNREERRAIPDDVERVYSVFPILKERRRQMAGELSGGQQQMLAIGRALMSRPRLLLLDEPSLGLAPMLVDLMFDSIVKINAEGTTVLLVEQNANKALSVSQYAYVMESGQIKFKGEGASLLRSDQIRDAYLGIV